MTREDIHSIIFSNNAQEQRLFSNHFREDIDRTIATLADAYSVFESMQQDIENDERTATVQMFLHSCFNSIITSLHLLVSGFPVPSGHLMRHFMEALSMALLCCDDRTGVYQVFSNNRFKYPVHKAPSRLRQKETKKILKERLEFDEEGWETSMKIHKLYDLLSHESLTSLAYQITLEGRDNLILGASFDEGKLIEYRAEMSRRRTSAEVLAGAMPEIMKSLT